jgi:hypothetical protein
VKISKLTNSLLVAMLLSTSIEVTAADSEYPATDFQPKVVFQDEDYKHTGSTSSSSSSSKKVKGEVSSSDPDYPAANFEPEVLYKDDAYKHSKGSVGSTSSNSKSTSENSGASDQAAEDSSMSLIIGLALLAAAGFAFYNKSKIGAKGAKKKGTARRRQVASKSSAAKQSSAPVLSGSESGVARYLEDKNGVEPSGVAKYLDEKNTSVSGVSKYVAKQKITARVASVTGVEKYLKDK